MLNAAVRTGRKSKLYRPARFLLIAAFFILLLAGCGGVAPVAKVGLVAPFEGRHRAIGYDVLYSARLAVREINGAGGIGGTRVALVALDDGGTPESAHAAAASLLVDPDVVAVVGHWLPETTEAVQEQYAHAELVFVPGGTAPYLPVDAQQLSPDFVAAYAAVTPFDEMPGPYAAPAYAAYENLWALLAKAQAQQGEISRASVWQALNTTG
ncbi:MAG: ABC transporter substrate-binding protein [Candidatus Promineifilaceae bacterium]|jgi:hypothetical protein